ncbi:hypothetical protein [Achromobacter anxifer]|uniref:hypothetical protein n=1 Tax=Achromobacter anxifer TaxID=1287737 RepID=UPI0023F69D16|nr:hypothetical protein [Achromobacter anxifer]MDF8362569.1 hypothetical protein [Achromobacter anxifer]
MNLHVIYSGSNMMLLSRREYVSWQQIQDEIADYMTSVGPWPVDEIIEFLRDEYPDLSPDAAEQVNSFLSGDDQVVALQFIPARGA